MPITGHFTQRKREIICQDCRDMFITKSRNPRIIRCPKCQKKWRIAYMQTYNQRIAERKKQEAQDAR